MQHSLAGHDVLWMLIHEYICLTNQLPILYVKHTEKKTSLL